MLCNAPPPAINKYLLGPGTGTSSHSLGFKKFIQEGAVFVLFWEPQSRDETLAGLFTM